MCQTRNLNCILKPRGDATDSEESHGIQNFTETELEGMDDRA